MLHLPCTVGPPQLQALEHLAPAAGALDFTGLIVGHPDHCRGHGAKKTGNRAAAFGESKSLQSKCIGHNSVEHLQRLGEFGRHLVTTKVRFFLPVLVLDVW